MAQESAKELIRAYLQDAIAAEKNFETQLRAFSKEGDDAVAQAMFSAHAEETRLQYGKLEARLEAIGGSSSAMKTMLAHMMGMMPKAAQIGHEKEERTVQNLIMAYTVENAEVAMYEAMATVAQAAGDFGTEQLARSIQQEERETAQKIWQHLPVAAREAFARVVGIAVTSEYERRAS
jgi:ferritin-like metal-binding protein YciE